MSAPSSGAGYKHLSLEDDKRIQKMLNELREKHPDRRGALPAILMDKTVKNMMIDYANELTLSVLEAASMMAKHRNADCIEVDDVKIILAKKLGVQLPASAHPAEEEEEEDGKEGDASGVDTAGTEAGTGTEVDVVTGTDGGAGAEEDAGLGGKKGAKGVKKRKLSCVTEKQPPPSATATAASGSGMMGLAEAAEVLAPMLNAPMPNAPMPAPQDPQTFPNLPAPHTFPNLPAPHTFPNLPAPQGPQGPQGDSYF